MAFVTIYVPRGLDDAALEKSMKQITQAAEDTLENTLTRMVRVTVFESDPARCYEGGETAKGIYPVVFFRIGPGRSDEAKDSFMHKIAVILSENLNIPIANIREFIHDNSEGHHFVIGGKVKDFSKKVVK